MKSLKEGGVYMLTFLDHTMSSGENRGSLECFVYGRVVWQDKETVDVVAWEATDPSDLVNRELFTIVKSCIRKARRLR